ncbi:MAG TPA: histidine kinase dimerization/phospho-acceptor domain-containing protein, partial [Longimicrobiaceae bacterium]|nr:histidine kinase dimerization/phospho-acceptor domain-containing protein [Longimicrobiaceae bacterium]
GDVLRARIGTGALARHEGELLPVEGSLEGRAVLAGEPQRSADLLADPRAYRPRERGLPAGPALAVPLGAPGGAVGALLLARGAGEPEFGAHEVHRMLLVAGVAASAIQNAREYERARASRSTLEAWRREREAAAWLARYVAAAREAHSVVFEWDPASDHLLWGDTLETVVGHSPGEYGATMSALVERVHPEDRERVREGVETARSGAPLRLQLRLPHRNAPFRCFLLQARAVEEGGTVVGVLEDVTDEWRKLPESRKRTETPARQIIRALRHEINNPLAVILGQAQLLGREDLVQGDPVLRGSIATIQEEGQRILELTRRLAALEQTGREPQVAQGGGITIPEE